MKASFLGRPITMSRPLKLARLNRITRQSGFRSGFQLHNKCAYGTGPPTRAQYTDADEWQAAMEALLRIGIIRALNRYVERVFDSSRKDHHWGRRKLAGSVIDILWVFLGRALVHRPDEPGFLAFSRPRIFSICIS